MVTRTERLKKLVQVQEQLKALHEARHAGHVSRANAAGEEAADLARRADDNAYINAAFPGLYNRRIDAALTRKGINEGLAKTEAGRIVTATLRANTVDEAYKQSARQDERQEADKERLEIIGRSTLLRK